jgi:hypothetical protein
VDDDLAERLAVVRQFVSVEVNNLYGSHIYAKHLDALLLSNAPPKNIAKPVPVARCQIPGG